MLLTLPALLMALALAVSPAVADYQCGGGTELVGSCQPYSKVDDVWMKNEDWIGNLRENVIDAGPVGDSGCTWVCTKKKGYASGCCGWYDDMCWCK